MTQPETAYQFSINQATYENEGLWLDYLIENSNPLESWKMMSSHACLSIGGRKSSILFKDLTTIAINSMLWLKMRMVEESRVE